MSKMVECKACGKEIAKGVKKCVHCGKDQRNFFMKHKIITAILVVIILVGINSAMGGKKDETNTPTSGNVATKKEESKVNYSNFLKIQMGANYEAVKAILGEGKELSSSEVSGIKTVMYTWNGSGISNMNITVQNDAVTGKAQLGLKSDDVKITLDKYNQVKEGMTYAETKAILGEGQIISQSKIMDMESIMYSWINKNGTNANCTFTGEKMMMKAQFNLK